MYDLIIKNGTVLDGTGAESFLADIAVKDGKIVKIEKEIDGAKNIIDATGLTVTPGFIDSHSHSDQDILLYPEQLEKIEQGITTAVGGQCGGTDAPLGLNATAKQIGSFGENTEIYRTMGRLLDTLKDIPLATNTATFVGHGSIRGAVMGNEDRDPTEDELNRMKDLTRDAMEHGAMGISFGLIYTPGCYAKTEELIALAKVVKEYDGLAAAHIRNEGDMLIEATEEFIEILRQSGLRGVLSHHKAAGFKNHGKVHKTLAIIDRAIAEGIDIYCDVYPYCASHTGLVTPFIPKDLRTGTTDQITARLADPETRAEILARNRQRIKRPLDYVLVTSYPTNPNYEGLRITEIAKLRGQDPHEAALDLLRDSRTKGGACYFTMNEEDVKTVLSYPRTMICTDSGVAKENKHYHPRLRGTFPRVLGRYVREEKITSLPEMIRKMTSLPAEVYGFETKGKIAEGYDADLCIFDADKIIDRAEFTNCGKRAEGLNYVIVAGQIAAENAVATGVRAGKFLLR